MRLLVYLLALLTGLSAAEAARPPESRSQTSATASLELVEVGTHTVASTSIAVTAYAPLESKVANIGPADSKEADLPVAPTPVSRSDISRQ